MGSDVESNKGCLMGLQKLGGKTISPEEMVKLPISLSKYDTCIP